MKRAGNGCGSESSKAEVRLVLADPQLRTAVDGLIVEAAVGAVVACDRFEQIVPAVRADPLRPLLRLETGRGEIVVHHARGDLVAPHGLDRRQAYEHLLAAVVRREIDRSAGDFWLIDLADRPRLARELGPDPVELRRVDAGHLDHRDGHLRLVVQQLAAHGVDEALDRVLGPAIGRLQRDSAVGERRSDQHDRAFVARKHALQRRPRAVDLAEIGDLSDPLIFFRRHIHEAGEDAGEGVVDPYVDGAEFAFDLVGCGLDRLPVGNVGGDRERFAAKRLDVALGCFEAVGAPREHSDIAPVPRELARRCPADAGGASGDDHGFGFRCTHGALLVSRPHPLSFHSCSPRIAAAATQPKPSMAIEAATIRGTTVKVSPAIPGRTSQAFSIRRISKGQDSETIIACRLLRTGGDSSAPNATSPCMP